MLKQIPSFDLHSFVDSQLSIVLLLRNCTLAPTHTTTTHRPSIMSWRNRIAAQPQVVQAPSDGPARFRNHDAERTIDKIVVQFEHGKWDDSAAQAVLQYVKKDDTLNWRVDRVVICQKPW